MKTDLLILGARKCRTTALFVHRPGTIAFEASDRYTSYRMRRLAIWDDLHNYNPQLKLIYLVCHLMDRVISAYLHMYERRSTDLPLEQSLTRDASILQVTRYFTQISPYVRKFGREQVLLLDFDDLTQRRQATLEQVAAFLGIDPAGYDPQVRPKVNAALVKTNRHHRFDHSSWPLRVVRRLLPVAWERSTDNSAVAEPGVPAHGAEPAGALDPGAGRTDGAVARPLVQ